MNKSQLSAEIAELTNITKIKADEVVNSLMTCIIDTLKAGNKINITGFGSFATINKAARAGRNPKTGEPVQIAAATIPKFIASKTFKEAIIKK